VDIIRVNVPKSSNCGQSATYKDRTWQLSRTDLDMPSNRAKPTQWANYIAASVAIVLASNNGTLMCLKVESKIFINNRHPGKVKLINNKVN